MALEFQRNLSLKQRISKILQEDDLDCFGREQTIMAVFVGGKDDGDTYRELDLHIFLNNLFQRCRGSNGKCLKLLTPQESILLTVIA